MRSRTKPKGEYICVLCLCYQKFWERSIQPWVSYGSTFSPIPNDHFHQDTENPQLSSLSQEQVRNKQSWKHNHGSCYLIYSRALRDTPPMHTCHIRWASAHPLCTRTTGVLFMQLQWFREMASWLGLYHLWNCSSFFFNHVRKYILFMTHVFMRCGSSGLKIDMLLGSSHLVAAFL